MTGNVPFAQSSPDAVCIIATISDHPFHADSVIHQWVRALHVRRVAPVSGRGGVAFGEHRRCYAPYRPEIAQLPPGMLSYPTQGPDTAQQEPSHLISPKNIINRKPDRRARQSDDPNRRFRTDSGASRHQPSPAYIRDRNAGCIAFRPLSRKRPHLSECCTRALRDTPSGQLDSVTAGKLPSSNQVSLAHHGMPDDGKGINASATQSIPRVCELLVLDNPCLTIS